MTDPLAHARTAEIREFDRKRTAPWTKADLERVRDAALALVKTHRAIPTTGKEVLTVVDGKAYWALLGALDRVGPGQED